MIRIVFFINWNNKFVFILIIKIIMYRNLVFF